MNNLLILNEIQGLTSPETIEEIKKLKNDPLMRHDPNFITTLNDLRNKGIEV